MPVRLRITILFTLIVVAILTAVCASVYYFSYQSRINNITVRLTNRAITTARLLSESGLFDEALIQKIDSSTAIALFSKSVEAFNARGNRVYTYSDVPGDTLPVSNAVLDKARAAGHLYFMAGEKDVVAIHVVDDKYRTVMVIGAVDKVGKQKLHELLIILLLSFVGGVVIVVAGGYFFSGRLLRPVRKIADEVNAISAQSLSRRINQGHSDDEWSYLARTLNKLLNRLQQSFEVQQRFISNASHELLTPLTSISSQLEVALQRPREIGQYVEVMQSIRASTRHLSKLTQTLLEFAKASGNPGGLEIDLIRIDEILLQLPGEIQKLNKGYQVALVFNNLPAEEEKLYVFGNQYLLLVAVKNIVVNACKYATDHKARVELNVDQGAVLIQVIDNGPGIPYEELENTFQPFYRAENAGEQEGFGLGLSLASQILKLHKGSLKVDSAVNSGAVFTIQLTVAGNFGAAA